MSTEQWEREYTKGWREFRARLVDDHVEKIPTILKKIIVETEDGKYVEITKDLVRQQFVKKRYLSDEEVRAYKAKKEREI